MFAMLALLLLQSAASAPAVAPRDALDVRRYQIRVVPHFETKTVDFSVTISGTLLADLESVPLDYTGPADIARANWNGKEATAVRSGARILVAPRQGHGPIQRNSDVQIELAWSGTPGKGLLFTNAGANPPAEAPTVLFTDGWPDWARTWLPCVDDPGDRAEVEITVGPLAGAPDSYIAVANGTPVPSGDPRVFRFKETSPIPTYLIALAAGPFVKIEQPHAALHAHPPIVHYVYNWCETAARASLAESPAILQFFENRLGSYPYAKFTFVQAPTRFGGMENAGCIVLAENLPAGKGDIGSTLAHEAAHQWFGDLVGIANWSELWLSEGFASYFASVFLADGRPGGDLMASMRGTQQSLLAQSILDRTPIVGAIPERLDSLLNPINYQKGACVLHALRKFAGEGAFWASIRRHVRTHGGRAITTGALAESFAGETGRDIATFLDAWTRTAGVPSFGTPRVAPGADGKSLLVTVEQTQPGAGFPCAFDVDLKLPGGRTLRHELVFPDRNKTASVSFPCTQFESVALDADGWVLHRGGR
jgi:aminopeptidase N